MCGEKRGLSQEQKKLVLDLVRREIGDCEDNLRRARMDCRDNSEFIAYRELRKANLIIISNVIEGL